MRVSRTISIARRCAAFTATIVSVLFLAACAGQPQVAGKGDQNDPWIVKVMIDDTNRCKILGVEAEANSCNLAKPSDICVKQGKFVQWVSNPAGTAFNIYFDPLVGQPLKAPQGKLRKRIAPSTPPSMYKYTVTGGDNCDPNNQDEIHDPAIRVDKP